MWGHRSTALQHEAQRMRVKEQKRQQEQQANRLFLVNNGVEVVGLSQTQIDHKARELREARPELAKAV